MNKKGKREELILLTAFFIKGKNNKGNDGARASAALVHLHQGLRPLDPFRRYCRLGKAAYFRQFRWGYGKFVGFWPKESKERGCLKSGRIYQPYKKTYKIWHEISTRLVESRAIFI